MNRAMRLFIFCLVIEAGIAGLWIWLATGLRSGALNAAVPVDQAIVTVSSWLGGAMGVVAALAVTLWFVANAPRRSA